MIISSIGLAPTSLRRRLGQRSRDLRLVGDRSQVDLALAAGISLPTLQRFESGANVSLDVFVRVAIALSAERELVGFFPLPDVRTIDEVLQRRKRPQRARRK